MTFRSLVVSLLLGTSISSFAQTCRLSVAGLNRSRKVMGAIHAECPEEIIHSAPFGNWGVSSNYGGKRDDHQFDGWCHNSVVCDNSGNCKTDCQDGWYEWNSCTDNRLYTPPNCTLYNATNCTEQVTTTDINVHGTKLVDIPVRCPFDSNGDGIPDQGGCSDVSSYASGTNFMSLYELDPVCCDELIQTVYFPQTVTGLTCDIFGCAPNFSSWVTPSFYDSPSSPPKAFAELATLVNWGEFLDTRRACSVSASMLNVVNGASYVGPAIAPESIASLFGPLLAPATVAASGFPLPTFLAGVSVRVTDRAGTNRSAPLFFVSPGQINFQVPPGTAAGAATITLLRADAVQSMARVQVESPAPAVFSANANGTGVAAALAIRVTPTGQQFTTPVFQCGPQPGSCAAVAIDSGAPADQTYLVLFGTGIRNTSGATVAVSIAGENARVTFSGPQNQFVGLDQVNVLVPPELRGRGLVDVVLSVGSKSANTVSVSLR